MDVGQELLRGGWGERVYVVILRIGPRQVERLLELYPAIGPSFPFGDWVSITVTAVFCNRVSTTTGLARCTFETTLGENLLVEKARKSDDMCDIGEKVSSRYSGGRFWCLLLNRELVAMLDDKDIIKREEGRMLSPR